MIIVSNRCVDYCALIGSHSSSNQMGEVGPVWLYPLAPLDCVIADPKKESKLYGLKSFIEYQITPNVRHRTHRSTQEYTGDIGVHRSTHEYTGDTGVHMSTHEYTGDTGVHRSTQEI